MLRYSIKRITLARCQGSFFTLNGRAHGKLLREYSFATHSYRPDKMAPPIHFITGNVNKLREVKAILEPHIQIQSQSLDLEEIQGTIEEVADSKCRRAADLVRESFSREF